MKEIEATSTEDLAEKLSEILPPSESKHIDKARKLDSVTAWNSLVRMADRAGITVFFG